MIPCPAPVDLARQQTALRGHAGIAPLGECTRLELAGPDRANFLNRLATNKLDDLRPGEGRETFLTNAKGHVLGHGMVWAADDRLLFTGSAGQGPALAEHLDYYRIVDDVQISDTGSHWRTWLLAGPEAAAIVSRVFGQPAPAPLRRAVVRLRTHKAELAGIAPLPAWSIAAPTGAADDIEQALLAAGAIGCDREAAELLRIEQGWPAYGLDITAANLPQEIDRNSQAISFRKGCYLGQETVARLDSRGHVNRLLRGVIVEGEQPLASGSELSSDGQPAGTVTSSAWCPTRNATIGLALLRRAVASPGTPIDFNGRAGRVVALPMPD